MPTKTGSRVAGRVDPWPGLSRWSPIVARGRDSGNAGPAAGSTSLSHRGIGWVARRGIKRRLRQCLRVLQILAHHFLGGLPARRVARARRAAVVIPIEEVRADQEVGALERLRERLV